VSVNKVLSLSKPKCNEGVEIMEVKGYKVFKKDWTCNGVQYTCPGIFEEDVKPVIHDKGLHFYEKASDCFRYYNFNPENKVAEVIAFGDVVSDGRESCTNKIKIVREIPWGEILCLTNAGNYNTGHNNVGHSNAGNKNTGRGNIGDCNTGCWNVGNRNIGDYNTGNCNIGNRNAGSYNIGDRNTGNRNTGSWNTGRRNTGNRNTGDWNKSSHNTGCFMTEEPKISMFNKPSDWSYRDWLNSDAYILMNQIPKNVVTWICSEDMTDGEKAEYPAYETAGGYLKVLDESECSQLWWNGLTDRQKSIIKALPNFDPEIFEQCTGIRCEE